MYDDDDDLQQTSIKLRESQLDWLRNGGGRAYNLSALCRARVDELRNEAERTTNNDDCFHESN